MSKKNLWFRAALAICAASALAACGGSDGPDAVADATSYAGAIAKMNTGAGVSSASLQATFAANYLDAGTTRAQLVDALGKDAAGFTTADYSGLPVAGLTDVAITGCNASNVCTFSGTLSNGDADTTTVPFSTQVVLENGNYRVLGDQKAS